MGIKQLRFVYGILPVCHINTRYLNTMKKIMEHHRFIPGRDCERWKNDKN